MVTGGGLGWITPARDIETGHLRRVLRQQSCLNLGRRKQLGVLRPQRGFILLAFRNVPTDSH